MSCVIQEVSRSSCCTRRDGTCPLRSCCAHHRDVTLIEARPRALHLDGEDCSRYETVLSSADHAARSLPVPSSRARVSSMAQRPDRQHGAFVYTGSGKSAQVCPTEAVELQWCLAKRDHKEIFCKEYVKRWSECCERANAHASKPTPEPHAPPR